jgi:hypothetical protein
MRVVTIKKRWAEKRELRREGEKIGGERWAWFLLPC